MKWFAAVILLLLAALHFGLSLPAYAMYALLGVMLVSRFLARSWSEHLTASREVVFQRLPGIDAKRHNSLFAPFSQDQQGLFRPVDVG